MLTTAEIGAAGARRAAALLGIAVCAEISNASLDEDAAKVDLHLKFRNPLNSVELIPIRCQVKSGKSFKGSSSNTHITLQNIGGATVDALSGTGTPGLIVWVPPRPITRMYWYAQDPRGVKSHTIRVNRQDYVRPSLRYDLVRLAISATWNKAHVRQTVKAINTDHLLKKAKASYAKLKSKTLIHPLVGHLKVTRLAWRHITRRSKTQRLRLEALAITPYIGAYLDKLPDRFHCNRQRLVQIGARMVETRFITCWYRDTLSIKDEVYTLVVRIREDISYPAAWESQPLPVTEIHQEATLASWWCKKRK